MASAACRRNGVARLIPVLRVKDGVHFDIIAPAGFRILAAFDAATKVMGRDLTITCGSDSHPPNDPHSRGEAMDLRANDLSDGQILALTGFLETTLGPRFTVLYETPTMPSGVLAQIAYVNAAATGTHIHVQPVKGTVFP